VSDALLQALELNEKPTGLGYHQWATHPTTKELMCIHIWLHESGAVSGDAHALASLDSRHVDNAQKAPAHKYPKPINIYNYIRS
jgi:hypothetical protein